MQALIPEEEVAVTARDLFFLQIHTALRDTRVHNAIEEKALVDDPMDSHFAIGKLLSALNASKINSAPGPGGITYAALRNSAE